MVKRRMSHLEPLDLLLEHVDPEPPVRVLDPLLPGRVRRDDPGRRPATRQEPRLAS